MIEFFKQLYLGKRFYFAIMAVVAMFVVVHFLNAFFALAVGLLVAAVVVLLVEIAVLFRVQRGVTARRITPEKLSNGDENQIAIEIQSFYNFPVQVQVIDEVPFQFQRRDLQFWLEMPSGSLQRLVYTLRPTKRGEYTFGAVNVFVSTFLGFAQRRFRYGADQTLPVYPSFLQVRNYELLAASNRLSEAGVKRVRRLGHSMEFEQIREYVVGDDIRTLNWKATARAGRYMVNEFIEEKSQPVYCVIDKGRMMKMPFEGLSLLDYAINASLVISNVALQKQDRAGLITFAEKLGILLKAQRRSVQMNIITELLYNQKTRYLESNYEVLYANIRRKINQRSLLLLFTNFDSLSSMHRQLPFLRRLNRDHLLVVIFFENTELAEVTEMRAQTTEEIYLKTVAEKFAFEKRQIVKELNLHGIQAVLSPPEKLTVEALNKYLELKARGLI